MIYVNLLLTCLKIFFARILDVCISTVRTTFVLRGKTIIVAILAFFEITIWFLVAREALNTELNFFIVISYSGGYTTGTILGTLITHKFINSNMELIVISNMVYYYHNLVNKEENTKKIKDAGYGVTVINKDKNQTVLLIETDKKRLEELTNLLHKLDNKAVITIKETRTIINGYI